MSVTFDVDTTHLAYQHVQRGTTVAELAEAWDVSRATIYGAFAKHGLPLRTGPSPEEHVRLQQQSGTPPEVYAYRAGIKVETLRGYAYAYGMRLALRLHTDSKAWWAETLTRFDPAACMNFLIRENLPLQLVAKWFHLLNKPAITLLWGFTEVRELTCDRYNDVGRFNNRHASTHVLGRGRTLAHVDIRVASEAYRYSHAWKYKHSK